MSKVIPLFGTEHDLARAISKGDAKAQSTLYESYSPKMLSICLRYMGDIMEAEDVMIEGFMRIFDKINQFNFTGSFEGWMRRIMVNEALMRLRGKKMINVELEEVRQESSNAVSVESNMQAEELLKIVNDLPVGYRTVFNLYAIEGYSHAEIAEQLQISEGTSKSQLSRARALLQERVKVMEKDHLRKTK
ncbi:MAG: sigma-70 family RNA polymerase sigma factor [Spirosomaceae bacterium]|nr:sigma-70 family RNA polymerase sigma factor [Spirosomataceae bacterium]